MSVIGLVLIVALVVGGSIVLASTGESASSTVQFAAFFSLVPLITALQLCWQVVDWRRIRSIQVPVVLDDQGVVLRSPQGTVRCPWAGIEAVSLEGRLSGTRLRVRCRAPSEGPAWDEVRWDFASRRKQRFVEAQGMQYSMRLLMVEPDQLAWAVWQHSGDRVRVVRR